MSVTATKSTMSVSRAAERLGISEATVRRRIDDGTLPGFRIGSVRRVLVAGVDQILDDALAAPRRTV